MASDEAYSLGGLGDLVELLVDGWRILSMHYADVSGPDADGPPAAFVELERPGDGRRGLYVPDDGRAYGHASLVARFRESPHIWKHRSPDRVPETVAELLGGASEAGEWGSVTEPFPEALAFAPATLRAVTPVCQTTSVDGVTIALTALERHEGGARVRYLAHAEDPTRRGAISVFDVLAVDDLGRRYRTATADVTRIGNRAEGTIVVAPEVSGDVARLTVTIGSAGDPEGQGSSLGPWVFPIRLFPDA